MKLTHCSVQIKSLFLNALIILTCVLSMQGCGKNSSGDSDHVDNPDVTDPDTTDPDTSDPGTSDPDPSDPDTSDPGTSDPDPSDPDPTDPNQGDILVTFDEDSACAGASYSVQDFSVEYLDLNLDLTETGEKSCSFTTTIPAREGYYVANSTITVQADTSNVDGKAQISVSHRKKGFFNFKKRSSTREDAELVATSKAITFRKCNEAVTFKTKIEVKTEDAQLVLGQVIASPNFGYKRCE